jgi:hypothetical protein
MPAPLDTAADELTRGRGLTECGRWAAAGDPLIESSLVDMPAHLDDAAADLIERAAMNLGSSLMDAMSRSKTSTCDSGKPVSTVRSHAAERSRRKATAGAQ